MVRQLLSTLCDLLNHCVLFTGNSMWITDIVVLTHGLNPFESPLTFFRNQTVMKCTAMLDFSVPVVY